MLLRHEGHCLMMQNYVFQQSDNSESYNFVEKSLDLLIKLCKNEKAADILDKEEANAVQMWSRMTCVLYWSLHNWGWAQLVDARRLCTWSSPGFSASEVALPQALITVVSKARFDFDELQSIVVVLSRLLNVTIPSCDLRQAADHHSPHHASHLLSLLSHSAHHLQKHDILVGSRVSGPFLCIITHDSHKQAMRALRGGRRCTQKKMRQRARPSQSRRVAIRLSYESIL